HAEHGAANTNRHSFPTRRSSDLHDLSTERLNEQDNVLLNRGYYEDLTRVNRMNSQLWELYNKRPNERALAKDEKAQLQKTTPAEDRKSTRLNSSHVSISYAVFCL